VSVLPRVSGREVVKALVRVGYERDRQRGSHIILRQGVSPHRRLVVPDHSEVAKGTLRAII
jgi:predicted RNA binding protein YcfA (HicA-like mRNA interferase family)